MFNWFKSKESMVDKERSVFDDLVARTKPSCDQSPAIEELQRKLKDSEDAFAKLNAEIEQGYIKDKLRNNGGTQLEYIEKLGECSVKYYDFKCESNQWRPSWFSRTMTHHWRKEYCIALRDFLVKNFPLETVEIKEEDEDGN